MPQRGEIEMDVRGHADDEHFAAGPDHFECLGERRFAADTIDDAVGAAGELVADEHRLGVRANCPRKLGGFDDDVGAQRASVAALLAVLGGRDDRAHVAVARAAPPR